MGSLQFEGEIDALGERQIKFIRDVLEKRGFRNNKVLIEPAGIAGDNYVANVKRISVIIEDGDNFKMIAKFAPENEALRLLMNTAIMFNNEIVMYEQVLPKFVSLQKAADVPEEDLLKYAQCYGCLTEEPYEVVLLEDLKESNFQMLDRFTSLNDESVRLVLKNFAILHSLSYALKKNEPETYDSFRSKLIDMWEKTNATEQMATYLNLLEEGVIAIVDEKYKMVLRGVVTQLISLSAKIKKTETHSNHLIIQQGDAWTNNILFKLEGDETKDCIMIDYQVSRESNPVSDIMYMIFNCTDHLTRSKLYFDWIDYYHNELDRSLSNFGLKASFIYPKDQLDADLKRYSKMYIGISVMLYSVLTRKPEEAKVMQDAMKDMDMQKMEDNAGLDLLSSDTVNIYKSRVQDLIDSYRLFGYLS